MFFLESFILDISAAIFESWEDKKTKNLRTCQNDVFNFRILRTFSNLDLDLENPFNHILENLNVGLTVG